MTKPILLPVAIVGGLLALAATAGVTATVMAPKPTVDVAATSHRDFVEVTHDIHLALAPRAGTIAPQLLQGNVTLAALGPFDGQFCSDGLYVQRAHDVVRAQDRDHHTEFRPCQKQIKERKTSGCHRWSRRSEG